MSQSTFVSPGSTPTPPDPVNPLVPDPDDAPDPMTDLIDGDGDQWAQLMASVEQQFADQAGTPEPGDPTNPDAPDAPIPDPADPTSPPSDPATAANGPGDDGGGLPGGPSAQQVEPPTADPTADPNLDFTQPVIPPPEPLTFGDGDQALTIPRDAAEQQLRWLASLTPEQRAAIEQALTSGAIQPAQSNQSVIQPTQVGLPPSSPVIPDLDPSSLEVLDAAVPGFSSTLIAMRDNLAQTQARLAAYESTQTQQAAQYAQQTQAQTSAQIASGVEAWKAAHPEFPASDVDYLVQRAAKLQVFPGLLAQHNNDAATATQRALDTAMWSDDRFVHRRLQAEFAAMQSTQSNITSRRAKAEAINGNAGSVPRDYTAPDPRQIKAMSNEQMITEMAKEIAADMDANRG